MEKAIKDGDFQTLERLTHGLRGAAGSYEMYELADLFLSMEESAKKRVTRPVETLISKVISYMDTVTIEYINRN